jgi:hypothetical protein
LKKRQHTTPTKQINKKSKKEIKRGWGKLGKEGLFSGNDFAKKKGAGGGSVWLQSKPNLSWAPPSPHLTPEGVFTSRKVAEKLL